MYCNNCGTQNNNGGKFCAKCGYLLENNTVQSENGQSVNDLQQQNQINNNIESIVNPDMKKYAIFSVVVGVVGIVCAFTIGLSLLWAALLSSIGFNFAQKGKIADKKLSLAGNILNGIVLGYGILVFILALLGIL